MQAKYYHKTELLERIEQSDKIILPTSILQHIAGNGRSLSPLMLFKLTNDFTQQSLYCGVLEFNPGELDECIYLPSWIIDNLCLFDITEITIETIPELTKGSLVTIQPHKTTFIELSNPKVVLEYNLRNYTCLNENTTITIHHNETDYLIDIKVCEPQPHICIVDTDLKVDFMPPLDYKEPEKKSVIADRGAGGVGGVGGAGGGGADGGIFI